MSAKQKILSGILREDLPVGNVDFRRLLSRLAAIHLGKGAAEADQFADLNLTKYWNWLKMLLDEQKRRGLNPYFLIPSSSSFAIACAGNDLVSSADAESQIRGEYLRTRAEFLRQIDGLDDRAYEALAVVASQVLGARNFHLTPQGNEGGVDFYAEMVVQREIPNFSNVGARIRVVGQCKKYSAPLAVDKFEQFLHTMQNVRHRSDRVRPHIPVWFNESNAPIIGWIISHQGFQIGSSDEANSMEYYYPTQLTSRKY